MTDNNGISLEAINFQINPKMPVLIEAEMEKIFAYVAEWDREYLASGEGIKDTKEARKKYDDISRWVINNVENNLKKIIKDGTGIILHEIVYNTVLNDISMYTTNSNEISELANGALGFGPKELQNPNDRIKIAQNLSNNFNKSKGTIDDKFKLLRHILCISLSCFCPKDLIPTKDVDRLSLNAKEITALILQQIGSVISFVETLGDLIYIGSYGNSILANIQNVMMNDPNELLKEIKTLKIEIAKNHDDEDVNDALEWFGKVKLPDVIQNIPGMGNLICFVLAVAVAKLWLSLLFSALNIAMLVVGVSTVRITMETFLNNLDGESRTTRDINRKYLLDRLADEYVSRYGMSKELSSALIRVEESSLRYNILGNYKLHGALRNSVCFSILTKTFYGFGRWINTFEPGDGIKNVTLLDTRLKKNMNNVYDSLNRYDLPLEQRKKLVADVDCMKHSYDAYMKMTKPFILFTLNKYMIKIMRVGFETFFSGNIDTREMLVINNEINKILSNKSGYYRTKFDELIK